MSAATELVASIRRDLEPVRQRLLAHPYLAGLEEGGIGRDRLRVFACEQHAIISSDLRSVAHLVSRWGSDFFLDVLDGERAALVALDTFADALEVTREELTSYEPQAGAHAYACYMAWLGAYASEAEVAAAYLVNFQAWGDNCGRMSRILQERYGLSQEQVLFFDLFATPAPDFEETALGLIEAGLARGVDARLVRRAARLLQAYELLYWDTLHSPV